MLWALLAGFLTKKPPAVQALVVGLCTGLFVAAMAEANHRTPRISSTILLVVVVATVSGALFFAGLRAQRDAARSSTAPAVWIVATYMGVWILSIARR